MTGPDVPPDAAAWITAFAEDLGIAPPDEATMTTLLDLAGVAAHASQRMAAPIACWLLGCAGLTPEEGLTRARSLSDG